MRLKYQVIKRCLLAGGDLNLSHNKNKAAPPAAPLRRSLLARRHRAASTTMPVAAVGCPHTCLPIHQPPTHSPLPRSLARSCAWLSVVMPSVGLRRSSLVVVSTIIAIVNIAGIRRRGPTRTRLRDDRRPPTVDPDDNSDSDDATQVPSRSLKSTRECHINSGTPRVCRTAVAATLPLLPTRRSRALAWRGGQTDESKEFDLEGWSKRRVERERGYNAPISLGGVDGHVRGHERRPRKNERVSSAMIRRAVAVPATRAMSRDHERSSPPKGLVGKRPAGPSTRAFDLSSDFGRIRPTIAACCTRGNLVTHHRSWVGICVLQRPAPAKTAPQHPPRSREEQGSALYRAL